MIGFYKGGPLHRYTIIENKRMKINAQPHTVISCFIGCCGGETPQQPMKHGIPLSPGSYE